jgi:MoxR-like ATPase
MFQLPSTATNANFRELADRAGQGLSELRDVAGLCLLAYFAGYRDKKAVNHVLLEGLNGTAKTTLVLRVTDALLGGLLRAFYQLTGWDRAVRVAGSPDQTPADLLGYDLPGMDEKTGHQRLAFNLGPLPQDKMVYYADELNRSPPKTQSIWLEPMAEGGQITLTTMDRQWQHRRRFQLPGFFLMGSQNPEFQEGTFPLPEALLDRFMVKITMPFTSQLAKLILRGEPMPEPVDHPRQRLVAAIQSAAFQQNFAADLAQVGGAEALARSLPEEGHTAPSARQFEQLLELEKMLLRLRRAELARLRKEVRGVGFDENAARHVARLVYDTWSRKSYAAAVGEMEDRVPIPIATARDLVEAVAHVAQGASPRAAFALRDLALAYAWAVRGPQAEVRLDDVEAVAPVVLRHRLTMHFQSALQNQTPDHVVQAIVRFRRNERTA